MKAKKKKKQILEYYAHKIYYLSCAHINLKFVLITLVDYFFADCKMISLAFSKVYQIHNINVRWEKESTGHPGELQYSNQDSRTHFTL